FDEAILRVGQQRRSQLQPTLHNAYIGRPRHQPGATPMLYRGFAYPSLILSALVGAALMALPAQAQTPRPGQLAPGPGQTPPGGQPPQAPPPGPRGKPPQQQAQQPAPPKPYKPIAVTPAQPYSDPSFVAFRKQLGDIANRKDRAALARIVVNNFFWMGEKGDK